MYFSYWCIYAGFNVSEAFDSFLTLSSLGLVNQFPLFVHFKNSPEYLTKRDSPGVYTFDKLSSAEPCLKKFSCSSELLLSYVFSHLCLMMSALDIPKYLQFSFSPSLLMLSWFCSSISFVSSVFPFFLLSACQIVFLYICCIFLFLLSKSPVHFHFFDWYCPCT